MNPYEILGVRQGATKEEIKKAYLRLAHIHHPDKGGSEEKFKEITNAYNQIKSGVQMVRYRIIFTPYATSSYSVNSFWNPHTTGTQCTMGYRKD